MPKITKYVSSLVIVIGIALISTAFQNCSDVSFDQSSKSTDPNQNTNGTGTPGAGGDTVPGDIPQNGGTTGGPPVTGGPGGTTNPVPVPPGFPPPPPGSTDAPPTAPPGTTFPPGTPVVPGGYPLPRVVQVEPPCTRLTWCAYELQLDKAYPMITDFDWRTNDDMSKPVSVPAGYIRAVPNTVPAAEQHYVPGSGHVRFLPGETVRKIYVLNINPNPAINITIPFIFSRCQYGAVGVMCSQIFRP